MQTQIYTFDELTTRQLYAIMRLRLAVFSVEQTCYYQDADDLDLHPQARHLLMMDGDDIAAYARILGPGVAYSNFASIGRVVNDSRYRGRGLGHELMRQSIQLCRELWPTAELKIGAQHYLESFYRQHGFDTVTEPYLLDGIAHVEMIYKKQTRKHPRKT